MNRRNKPYMSAVFAFSIFFLTALLFPSEQVTAVAILTGEAEPKLTQSPNFPQPNSNVTVSLAMFGVDADGATVSWSIDGVEASASKNERSIVVSTKDSGRATVVSALVGRPNRPAKRLSLTIIPGTVDIIVEPQTNVPLGYKGRALPSIESSYRAVAIPQIYVAGKRVPSSELIYTWEVNGRILFGGPTLGKDTITALMPSFGNGTITVTVTKRDGTAGSRESLTLRPTDPLVLFYEESTLYGTVLSSPHSFIAPKDEVVMRAEPYYLSRASLSSGELSYDWTIDGRRISNPSTDPREITLKRTEGAPSANVGFKYTSTGEAIEYGNAFFNITFTDAGFVSL